MKIFNLAQIHLTISNTSFECTRVLGAACERFFWVWWLTCLPSIASSEFVTVDSLDVSPFDCFVGVCHCRFSWRVSLRLLRRSSPLSILLTCLPSIASSEFVTVDSLDVSPFNCFVGVRHCRFSWRVSLQLLRRSSSLSILLTCLPSIASSEFATVDSLDVSPFNCFVGVRHCRFSWRVSLQLLRRSLPLSILLTCLPSIASSEFVTVYSLDVSPFNCFVGVCHCRFSWRVSLQLFRRSSSLSILLTCLPSIASSEFATVDSLDVSPFNCFVGVRHCRFVLISIVFFLSWGTRWNWTTAFNFDVSSPSLESMILQGCLLFISIGPPRIYCLWILRCDWTNSSDFVTICFKNEIRI